jgi:dienelactone hydrolase
MVRGSGGRGGRLREYPAFVPHGDEHIASVVTVPDEGINGLVLLLTGTGAGRSHRFQLWTRTADRLAGCGLATVRMEYLGIGDSTGRVRGWERSAHGPQLEQAASVARAAMRGVGVNRFAVAGNCFGALVALDLMAADPACTGALCLMPLIQEGAVHGIQRRARTSRLGSGLRARPLARRLLLRPARRLAGRMDRTLAVAASGALSRGPVRFVYGREDEAFARGVQATLDRSLARLPDEVRSGFDLLVTDVPLAQFESVAAQEATIDLVERFMVSRSGAATT